MLRIILIGPQGSGKGTQAELLMKKFAIPQISTGNILRDNMEKGTELGKVVRQNINEGKLVPDEVTIGIVKERLGRPDCRDGFILDGFPRNLVQADGLKKISNVDMVIEIYVPDRESIKRISGRRTCKKCNAVYHVFYNPPKIQEICDKCGSRLVQREDDREDTIRKRLELYHKETKPLVNFYKNKHIKIDGVNSIENVFEKILEELKKRKLAV